MWWFAACDPDEPRAPAPPPPPAAVGLVGEPVVSEGTHVPLARRLQVELDRPAQLVLTLRSDRRASEVVFAGAATTWDVPVLGLSPDTAWEVAISAEEAGVRGAELAVVDVVTEPLPLGFPTIDVVAHDPARATAVGWLLSITLPDGAPWLAVYDPVHLEVVWLYTGPIDWGDARIVPATGHVFGLYSAAIEMDLLGDPLRTWSREEVSGSPWVPLPWGLSHEAFWVGDGTFWSVAGRRYSVDAYPASYEDPTPVAPADIEDPLVVHVGYDGEVLAEWSMAERLDPSRIGYGSLESGGRMGLDWGHGNAVVPDPAGGVVVSVRHQDALVGLDEGGAVRWILGDPAGFSPPVADALLAPVGEVRWPYHQHGPAFDADGVLWVMDNHTFSATPYGGAASEAGPSRLVGFAIDAEAGTVRQVGEWFPPTVLESVSLGSADPLGGGRYLVDFGMTKSEDGVPNIVVGWGKNHARVMEVDLDDPEPIVDLRVRTDSARSYGGVNVYRADPVPSLYGEAATVVELR